jgi:uncharacterized protein (DUF427 family)
MSRNVWDFPRPPAVEVVGRWVRVVLGGVDVAATHAALEVLETSHPPTVYVPPEDVLQGALRAVPGRRSFCEFKGFAVYWDVVAPDGTVAPAAAWSYPDPTPGYAVLRDHVAFYPSRFEACFVGDEQVQAQEGDFYGGWITSDLQGPFKGGPGTLGW